MSHFTQILGKIYWTIDTFCYLNFGWYSPQRFKARKRKFRRQRDMQIALDREHGTHYYDFKTNTLNHEG